MIRIVVVASGDAEAEGAPPDDRFEPAPMSVETTAGLARLGDPVELIRAGPPESIAQIVRDPSIDLVLLDRVGSAAAALRLAAIPADGPPSVVVVRADSEAEALEAFRAGASDCVYAGTDYENVLPVVLLEQVQRWRSDRQRRVSEERIRWLEDLYRGIVSEMPAGLVVVDVDGLIVAENPEFSRLFPSRSSLAPPPGSSEASSASPEFLAARLPPELIAAAARLEAGATDAASRAPARAERAACAGQPSFELVRVESSEHDLASRDARASARAFEIRHRRLDESGRGLLLISEVTESEWLSERLEAMRRDSEDVLDTINSALVVVDPGGRISFANPAAETVLGAADDRVTGRRIEDWFGPGADGPSPIERCLADGTRSRGTETMLQRDDGQWIPVGVWCSPRREAAGRKRGVVAVFQDLSELRELEQHVRQTEKMASIGQLAAGVAHEVNNPMGFIHANLHQMSEYLGDLEKYFEASNRLLGAVTEAAGSADLEMVRAAAADVEAIAREIDLDFVRSDFEKALAESGEGAERIRHIVKDLRDFSRADLPARTPSDVNQAIDSTANIVYSMMKRSVQLEKQLRPLPEIHAYPMQLKQVFMNLLVNAHQAIEARGEPEPGVIRIETEQIGREIVVRISDTGVGIPESDLPRIFEPFFTTKPVGAGTGLGLSTCFSIIERHGGRIVVESEVGRGTLFEIWLPTDPASEEAVPPSTPAVGSDS